ncbi:MAG: hypothetical protein RL582_837 [Bacteroidota bacterium]
MNIKYNISPSDSYQVAHHPFLTIRPQTRSMGKESQANAPRSESVSVSEIPNSTLNVRENMDQEILVQGLAGLKMGLSDCLKIGRTPFGFAWKQK